MPADPGVVTAIQLRRTGSTITFRRDLIFMLFTLAVVVTTLFVVYPRMFGRNVYTLYRNSGRDMSETGYSAARIHIATFDANETGAYNQENCDVASKLFAQHTT